MGWLVVYVDVKKICVIGVGFFGVVIVCELVLVGMIVDIFESCDYFVGNCYLEWDLEIGVMFYVYGFYIFYISNEKVWNYVW